MVSGLTICQSILLFLSFPFLNTSTLVRIKSRYMCPGVIELMESNDFIIYKMQQDEIMLYTSQMLECLKSENVDTIKLRSLANEQNKAWEKHLKFDSYCLFPGQLFWFKKIQA